MIRCRTPEMMDDPRLDARTHEEALRALNRINRLLLVDRRIYMAIGRVAPPDRASVLDLGAGGGGFLDYVAARQGRAGGGVLVGLDLSPFAAERAQAWFDGTIWFLAGDARRTPLADKSIDVVTCSLFLHHFAEAEVVEILREAARVARRGIVVSDLSRSRLALVLTWITTRIVSRSRLFHVDGPRSVRNAFRPAELTALARQAGLTGVRVGRRFPFQLMLTWRRPEADDVSV